MPASSAAGARRDADRKAARAPAAHRSWDANVTNGTPFFRPLWLLLAAATVAVLIKLSIDGKWMIGPAGELVAHDFLAFWSAAERAAAGEAALAYDWATHVRFQQALIGRAEPAELGFFNPPHALLLFTPFSVLSYLPAMGLFVAATAGAYALLLRAILKDMLAAAALTVSVGAATYCLWWGQTGFLTATLLVGGLLALREHRILAGILFGLLTIKPQLGLAAAVVLLAGREWQAIGWAAGTALALALVAELLFGPGIWLAFIDSASTAGGLLQSADQGARQSLYAWARQGADAPTAAALQAVVSLAVLAALAHVWRLPISHRTKCAFAIAATPLSTPYFFHYDAVMLGAAIALLVADRARLSAAHRLALVAACLMPVMITIFSGATIAMTAALILGVAASLARREAKITEPRDASATT